MTTRYYEETPCEVCGLYEFGEHFDQFGEWCDGAGARRRELEDVQIVDWCESHFAVSSDGRYCDFSPDGDACRIVRAAIIPLSGDTE